MKKVYLVNISGAYQTVLPYSCGLLQAYAIQDPEIASAYSFADYIFHVPQSVTEVAGQIDEPAVLGLSLLSWNVRRSMKLARIVKECYPQCLIVVGGPEVPDRCENFLQQFPFVDIAVHKEGEETFRQILAANHKTPGQWETVSGVSYVKNGIFTHVPRQHAFIKPISTPSPYLLGLFEASLDYVDRMGLQRLGVWETNRGCPYSCTFCDWGSFVNQKLRLVDEERIHQEIEYIGRRFDEIHIADANFGIIPRDLEYAKRLAEAMRTHGKLKSLHITYAKSMSDTVIEIAELVEDLKVSRAGFTFGIQSFNSDVLKNIKRKNVPVEKFKGLQKRLEAKNIPTNAEMILGLPGETKESFLNGVNICIETGLTDLRAYQLSIYPNSEINTPEQIEKYSISHESVRIVEGAGADEDEFIESVTATRDMSTYDIWYLKKLVECVDHIHFGRWTYYIAEYCHRKMGLKYTDFYDQLLTWSLAQDNSVLKKIADGEFIDRLNSGSWNAYKGPHSPFNVDWGNNFFRKSTFHWLCIGENRRFFFEQVTDFLNSLLPEDEKIADLVKFQDSMIIDFNYDPNAGKCETFKYNWHDHFKDGRELLALENTLVFSDATIGRFKHPLKPADPQTYFYVAGGYSFHFQKIDAFEFQKLKVNYVRDGYELRFEHRALQQQAK